MKGPFLNLQLRQDAVKTDIESVFREVFESGTFILGKEVQAFEQAYANFNQTKEAIGVSSGLDALILSLTALAVSHVGATPVFVEPNKETYNLNPDLITAAISSKTKAVIPVYLYGQPREMDAIMQIVRRNNLFVIEDNAQTHGATFNGKLTGSLGKMNATSFYPTKNLGVLGDAGAVTTNDLELTRAVRTLRNYGSPEKT